MPDLITRLRRFLESGGGFRECRRCGTGIDGAASTCPSCGSREIARYDV